MLNSSKSFCTVEAPSVQATCVFWSSRHHVHVITMNLHCSNFAHPRQEFCWCWLALTQIPELWVWQSCARVARALKFRVGRKIQLLASEYIFIDDLSQSAFPYLLMKAFLFFWRTIYTCTQSVFLCPCGLRSVRFEHCGFCAGALQGLLSCHCSLYPNVSQVHFMSREHAFQWGQRIESQTVSVLNANANQLRSSSCLPCIV